MGEWKLVPTGNPVTLTDCPVGLFENDGLVCLKTEYGNNEGRIDAYIEASGEFFWGDAPQTIASQRQQVVQPLSLVASPAPSLPEDVERVVRFDHGRYGMRELPNGGYVLFSDYRALSSQLAEARANFNEVSRTCGEYLDQIDDLKAERDRLAADNERLREVLTPSGETKAAYIGEFYERIEIANPEFDDDDLAPETIMHPFMVSWTTIKEIMAAISARAALDPGETLDPEDFPSQSLQGVPASEICPGCDGSGEYADWGGVCPTCGGTGAIRALAGKAGEA